jgi:hypothetical protein
VEAQTVEAQTVASREPTETLTVFAPRTSAPDTSTEPTPSTPSAAGGRRPTSQPAGARWQRPVGPRRLHYRTPSGPQTDENQPERAIAERHLKALLHKANRPFCPGESVASASTYKAGVVGLQ